MKSSILSRGIRDFSLVFVLLVALFCPNVFGQNQKELIERRDPSVYTHFEVLSPGYVVQWTVYWNERRIEFTVEAQTRGYVAFGLSAKGYPPYDMVIGGVENGRPYFTDRYGVDNRTLPQVDQSQDWDLNEATENGTHTVLRFSRAFDTCDQNDYPINDDTINIIWAYGNTDSPSEEWQSNSRNRGTYPVYLLDPNIVPRDFKETTFRRGPPPRSLLAQNNLQLWTLNTRQRLPPNETIYHCSMHRAPRMQRKHHAVAYNTRLETEEARRHVHHIILYRCSALPGRSPSELFERFVGGPGEQCFFPERIQNALCLEVFTGYAIGARLFFFPDHLGQAIGENTEEYYVMQTHYDNPQRRSDLEIEVNVDVFYTDQLRPNEIGMINLGHNTPGGPSILIPPNTPAHTLFGHCSSQCTERMIPDEGIKIAGVILHTHTSGRKVRVRHFRRNQELPWISDDSNYDNAFQAMRLLRNEVTVRKGDQITVQCEDDNTWTNGTVVGGFATKQEMCLVFFIYYQKLEGYPTCRSGIESVEYMQRYLGITNTTFDSSRVDVVATAPPNRAGRTITEISDTLTNWTPQLRRQLQNDHISLPQESDCPMAPIVAIQRGLLSVQDFASGNIGPYALSQMAGITTLPRPISEYQRPPRVCGARQPQQQQQRNRNSNLNNNNLNVLDNNVNRLNFNFPTNNINGGNNRNFGSFGLNNFNLNPTISNAVRNIGNNNNYFQGIGNVNQNGLNFNNPTSFNSWTGLGGQGLNFGNVFNWGKPGPQNGGWGRG